MSEGKLPPCDACPVVECFLVKAGFREHKKIPVARDTAFAVSEVALDKLRSQAFAIPTETRDVIFAVKVFALEISFELVE